METTFQERLAVTLTLTIAGKAHKIISGSIKRFSLDLWSWGLDGDAEFMLTDNSAQGGGNKDALLADFLKPDLMEVLVEVNVGGEETKGGCTPDELGALLEAVRRCQHLRPTGLMTLAPYLEDAEQVRPYFAMLRALRDAHGGAAALPELSMGMSHDFEAAIAEGATLVRVGRALFGARGLAKNVTGA